MAMATMSTCGAEWVEPPEDPFVIVMEGEIDLLTARRLVDPIDRLDASAPSVIVFDFTRVTFIDSTGLSALVVAERAVRSIGRRLVLRGVSPRISKVLHVTQLDRSLTIEGG
jgi:anti-sigma B factor antagonist